MMWTSPFLGGRWVESNSASGLFQVGRIQARGGGAGPRAGRGNRPCVRVVATAGRVRPGDDSQRAGLQNAGNRKPCKQDDRPARNLDLQPQSAQLEPCTSA